MCISIHMRAVELAGHKQLHWMIDGLIRFNII